MDQTQQQSSKKHEEDEAPKVDDRSFLQQHGVLIILGLFLFHLVAKDSTTKQEILPLNYFFIIVVVLIVVDYLFRLIGDKLKKKDATIPYVPFNPEIEIPQIEERFQKMGKRITIYRYTKEPKYGEKSVAPRTIWFHAHQQLNSGLMRSVTFGMNVLHRTFSDFEPEHLHIENSKHDWSGALKEEGSVSTQLYQSRPTIVIPKSSRIVERQQEEQEEIEQEEEE